MEYLKLICRLAPDNEINRELLTADLGNAGFESFTETDTELEAYIPSKDFKPEILTDEIFTAGPFYTFTYTTELIADQNWNEVWEKNYFEPLLIEEKCLIRAPFHREYPTADYEIIIEPKMAFGTGNHETTWLMVSAILQQDIAGKQVLDMGCGTGILGILASMRGAASVTGIDIDEWAYNNTIENAALNQITNLNAQLGDASLIPGLQFDLIYANIQRNILLQDMKTYATALKTEGEIWVSGFYSEDLPAISEEAARCGLKYATHRLRANWCAARFDKH